MAKYLPLYQSIAVIKMIIQAFNSAFLLIIYFLFWNLKLAKQMSYFWISTYCHDVHFFLVWANHLDSFFWTCYMTFSKSYISVCTVRSNAWCGAGITLTNCLHVVNICVYLFVFVLVFFWLHFSLKFSKHFNDCYYTSNKPTLNVVFIIDNISKLKFAVFLMCMVGCSYVEKCLKYMY